MYEEVAPLSAGMKTRKQELSEKADRERRLARDWLLQFMEGNQPRFLTKDELRAVAMPELGIIRLRLDRRYRADPAI
jgi:hypothetical protein